MIGVWLSETADRSRVRLSVRAERVKGLYVTAGVAVALALALALAVAVAVAAPISHLEQPLA